MSNVVVVGHSSKDERDDACVDTNPVSSLDAEHINNSMTKKKKKKKKKKRTMIDRVVSSIGANDSNVLWVRLNSCRLGDDHMSSLCAALEKNTHVLSLDLSDNEITERGLGMLCDCLCQGGASDMIELDVRGNSVGCGDDVDRIVEKMMDVRKVVHVMVDGGRKGARAGSSDDEEEEEDGCDSGSGRYSKIVEQVFDVTRGQDDEENENSMGVEEENVGLWKEVTYCVAKHDATTGSEMMLPTLSSSLFALNEYVQSELVGYKLPLLEDTTLDDLHPVLSLTLEHVHVLDRILDFQVPPAFQTQYHKDVMVPRLGSHRVMAVTIAASALKTDCPCVSEVFAETKIVEKAVRLSLQFPSCSMLHAQCLDMARVAVSPHSIRVGLWKQLVSCRDVWESIGNILQSLPSSDAHRNASAVSGMLAGFCIEFVRLLRHQRDIEIPPSSPSSTSSSDDDRECQKETALAVKCSQEELKSALETMPGWDHIILSIEPLLHIQEQQLGGSPPPRMNAVDSFNDSMNFTGPQLLALLQGLNLSSAQSSLP